MEKNYEIYWYDSYTCIAWLNNALYIAYKAQNGQNSIQWLSP